VGGEDLRDRVLDRASVERDRQFRIDTIYSDAECLKLLDSAREEIGCSDKELFDIYASAFVAETQKIFPQFYATCSTSEEFLRKQAAIHALIGASLRDKDQQQSINDKFEIEDSSPGNLLVHYDSPNKLCGLYHALAHAVADVYDDKLSVRTVNCSKRNSKGTACEFLVTWLRAVDSSTTDEAIDSRSEATS